MSKLRDQQMTRKEKIAFLKALMSGSLPMNGHLFEIHIRVHKGPNLYYIDGKAVDKSFFEENGGFESTGSLKIKTFIGDIELSRD